MLSLLTGPASPWPRCNSHQRAEAMASGPDPLRCAAVANGSYRVSIKVTAGNALLVVCGVGYGIGVPLVFVCVAVWLAIRNLWVPAAVLILFAVFGYWLFSGKGPGGPGERMG